MSCLPPSVKLADHSDAVGGFNIYLLVMNQLGVHIEKKTSKILDNTKHKIKNVLGFDPTSSETDILYYKC